MRRAWLAAVLGCCCMVAPAAWGLELEEVVKRIERSVVRINTDEGLGSGVVVDDNDLVLTNFHVIDGAKTATVVLRDGARFEVRGFLAIDPGRDLALLKTSKLPAGLTAKVAGGLPAVGAKVAAFGNPEGLAFSASEGIVAALRSGKDVAAALGEVGYQELGYAEDAQWIQTTAAISNGNSGGPLVNMDAEVVGLNTWSYLAGNNLNFAIAQPDIVRFIAAHRTDQVNDLRSLPARARIVVPVVPYTTRPTLTLPNGKVLSAEVFEFDETALLRSAGGKNRVVFTYPNGSLQAAAQERAGKLHGVTVGQYETETPMIVAHYVDGSRHGLLKTWNQQGERMLYAQYDKGRRNGFLCFFQQDRLTLVVYYDHDRPEWIQLMADNTPLDGFDSLETARKNEQAQDLLAKLEEYDTALKRDEYKFKMTLREIEMDRRRLRAASLAPEKRARIQSRMDARAKATDAVIQSMYRKAYGR